MDNEHAKIILYAHIGKRTNSMIKKNVFKVFNFL